MLVWIDSGYFYAGLVIEDDRVTVAAPIIKYMMGWSKAKARDYVIKKGWKSGVVDGRHL